MHSKLGKSSYLVIAAVGGVAFATAAYCGTQSNTTQANPTNDIQSAPLNNSGADLKNWKALKPAGTVACSNAKYYEFKTPNGSAAHLLVIDAKSKKLRIRPVVNTPGRPTSETLQAHPDAVAAVNGGYFNLSNGLSTSYITMDGKIACDPNQNPALVGNEKLAPFMPVILDRTELRFLQEKSGSLSIQIAPHSAAVPAGKKLVDALQAGPRLLPMLTADSEAFVRTESDGKKVDSIGSNRPAARTAFGVTGDGHALILCIASTKQDEFSAGVTLSELAAVLKTLGCIEAINFDGGTSTTMVVRLTDSNKSAGARGPVMVCGRSPETRVKSVLLIEEIR